ncbi:MAG: glucose-phosphate thymidylyltransferase [Cellvibrio sp.]|nr:glucose-phosphate thymidylyltransferase [Cellvibrio sp.]
MDNEQLKSNLTSSKHWLRLVFMLLFAAVLQLASLVMWVLVAVQFIFSLVTGEDNQHLRRFGHSLSTYIYDVLKFLCYSSEEKPFPFADWPAGPDVTIVVVEKNPPVPAGQSKPLTDAPDEVV